MKEFWTRGVDKTALAYMAATIYGEARGEPYEGKLAVGHVIKNRAARGGWYGTTVKGVVMKAWQFSCWNIDDPNYDLVKPVKDGLQAGNASLAGNETIGECLSAAFDVLTGECADNTEGSLHYHSEAVTPIWTAGKKPVVKIGNHLFYNDIDKKG